MRYRVEIFCGEKMNKRRLSEIELMARGIKVRTNDPLSTFEDINQSVKWEYSIPHIWCIDGGDTESVARNKNKEESRELQKVRWW